jgi:hypothetical protein
MNKGQNSLITPASESTKLAFFYSSNQLAQIIKLAFAAALIKETVDPAMMIFNK